MARTDDIDWITIEGQYRANLVSIRAIAREHKLSEAGIRKRARDRNWARDPAGTKREIVKAAMAGNQSEADYPQKNAPGSHDDDPAQTIDPQRIQVQPGRTRVPPVRSGSLTTANTIADAALEDIRDMRSGLYNARRVLEVSGQYLDTQFEIDLDTNRMVDPRFLKAIMDASSAAIDQIRKIRDLDSKIPDEMEALKLLVSAGWMPDELLVSAFQEYRTIKPSMKNIVRSHFQSTKDSGNSGDG